MEILLPISLVIVGTGLGLLSSLLVSARQQRENVASKLLDQYLEVRRDVVNTVSDLTNLQLREEWQPSDRFAYRDSVSKLYYMHYDFLPEAVLDALILLHVALDHPERGPYMIENDAIVPIEEPQIFAFIEGCSLFRNAALAAPLALKSEHPTIKGNQVIKLHTRHVLYTLNQFSSIDDLLKLANNLKKVARS